MPRRFSLLALLLCAIAVLAQKYSGPRPPKSDVPFLLHADTLVETESREAQEQTRKDQVTYIIPGDSSPARTPLAGPIFLLQAEKLIADKMELYRLEVKDGHREVSFSRKKKQRPMHLEVTRVADNLYRIEVSETLENGEYSLTPSGSNQVFCFQVY